VTERDEKQDEHQDDSSDELSLEVEQVKDLDVADEDGNHVRGGCSWTRRSQ